MIIALLSGLRQVPYRQGRPPAGMRCARTVVPACILPALAEQMPARIPRRGHAQARLSLSRCRVLARGDVS